jgi:hypothetical protein
MRGSALLVLESSSNSRPSSSGWFKESAMLILNVCAWENVVINSKSNPFIFFIAAIYKLKYTLRNANLHFYGYTGALTVLVEG